MTIVMFKKVWLFGWRLSGRFLQESLFAIWFTKRVVIIVRRDTQEELGCDFVGKSSYNGNPSTRYDVLFIPSCRMLQVCAFNQGSVRSRVSHVNVALVD